MDTHSNSGMLPGCMAAPAAKTQSAARIPAEHLLHVDYSLESDNSWRIKPSRGTTAGPHFGTVRAHGVSLLTSCLALISAARSSS